MLFYNGVPNNEWGRVGVICLVHGSEISNNTVGLKFINERLAIYIKEDINNVTLNITYGPNDDEHVDIKDSFYESLQNAIDANYKVMIIGDYNGRVGNNPGRLRKIMGTHEENIINDDGERCWIFEWQIT